MGTLLWSDFLRFAQDFLLKSDQLNDGWSLLGDSFNEGGAYLKKIVYRNISNQYSNINKTWVSEYHICYSVSYQVPVVYFNMTDESGALIKLEQIWDICKFNTSGDHSELYSTLTQQEHPILHKPFYTVHPCRTHELLVFNNPNFNPIVAILSIVGPKINLPIKIDYAVR